MSATPIPAHAEPLNLFEYLKRDRQMSKLAPPAMTLRLSLICPACVADLGPVPFSEQVDCACGLHLWPGFSQLHVWRDQPQAAE